MKTIYVNTEDYRSYSTTPDVIWDTIEVKVSNDFQGGGKTYNPLTKEWIDDPIPEIVPYIEPEPTAEELKQERSRLIQEATILKDIDPDEYGLLIEKIKTITEKIKSLDQ